MFDLAQFNKYKEDNRREVKKAKGGLPDSLWSTYSAYANCYGGVVILGVAENEDGSWYTTGLQDENKLRRDFWNMINNRQKVSANLLTDSDVQTYQMNQDTIMVIYVPAAKREQKPVYINNDLFGGTFRRNWEGDYHCTPGEVKAMLRDQTEDTMDMKILENMQINALNMETVHAYRNRHMAYRSEHVWEQLKDEDYLERIGAARVLSADGKLHPTAAGLLMFGDEYKILYEYPEYFLDFRELLDPSIRFLGRISAIFTCASLFWFAYASPKPCCSMSVANVESRRLSLMFCPKRARNEKICPSLSSSLRHATSHSAGFVFTISIVGRGRGESRCSRAARIPKSNKQTRATRRMGFLIINF